MTKNWTDEQLSAINVKDKNILVSASAGSGKTAVLVERVVEKVLKEKIDIDKIMIVTFTNAAASELKERLYNALSKKLEEDINNIFLKKQLRNLGKATICTMDSFCLNIVKENFHILNVDPQFKICSNQDGEILRNDAINFILEEEYKENEEKLYKLLELFGSKEEKLIECIFKIYSYIQSFDSPLETLKFWIGKYNIDCEDLSQTDFGKNILDDVLEDLNILYSQIEILYEKVRRECDFEKFLELIDEDISYVRRCIVNTNNWDSLYELLNFETLRDNLRNKVANTELKDEIKDFRNGILKKKISEISKRIYNKTEEILQDNKIAYQYLTYLYDLIIKFNNKYMDLKDKNNLLEFDDVRHLAISLLYEKDGKYSDIANNFKEKFIEVYTDEYQDTNYIQEKILDAISKENNRFMVGDVKQSIYKFIQARPEIFNEKYNEFRLITECDKDDINTKIVLAKNFRSRGSVINGINYIFEKIMTNKLGDCNYSGIETLKNGATWYKNYENQDYKIDLEVIDINKEKLKLDYEQTEDESLKEILELEKFEKEAIKIAEKIKYLKENFKVYDASCDKFENTKYSDIVILLRSIKNKGIILESVLKKYNIPSFCDSSTNLFLSDEVLLVMSFLKILDNPLLDIDLISVLYSIIGNFSLDEITKIKLSPNAKGLSIFECLETFYKTNSEKGGMLCEKIEKFLGLYDKFKNFVSIYSTSEIIKILYIDTNIYNQYILDDFSGVKIANLNLLLEVAKDFEKNNCSYLLADFIGYIEKLKISNNTDSVARVIGENEDVVRIMTIHKSKGLEFNIVILADTTSKYQEKDLQKEIVLHQDLGVGINVINDEYNVSYPSIIKQSIKSISTREIRSEELRMLYVALTRAKEKLCIFATLDDFDKFKEKQYIIRDEKGIINPSIIAKNNNYFSNIYMALNDYAKDKNLFNINITKVENNYLSNISDEVNNNKKTLSQEMDDIIAKKVELDKEKIVENINRISKNFSFEYKFKNDIISKSRVSVSALKEEYIKNSENDSIPKYNEESSIENKLILPGFLDENKNKCIPVRKGILVHYILENLDFSKINTYDDLKESITDMAKNYVFDNNDISYINIDKIYKFLNSDIGIKLKNAKKIYREEEFVLEDQNYSSSIIQGVIDLYFITNNNKVILVDFKTDRMRKEEDYISKYKIQLDIYKEAIEKIKNIKVDEVYIYSFELDKKILVV